MITKKSTLYEKIQVRNVSVLFVCVGNACRSRMAEAFANAYGSDVLDASSAGLVPATRSSRTTRQVMSEKRIAIDARERTPGLRVVHGPQLPPLVQRQHFSQLKVHHGVLPFELATSS